MASDPLRPDPNIPLFAIPRVVPPPPPPRPSGPSISLTASPPGRDLLLRTLRPILSELSADALAFGRTAAYLWGVDVHPRGTSVTRERLRVALPPGVRGASRHGVVVHRELIPYPDRSLIEGVRVTAPARTALDLAAEAGCPYRATALLDRFLARGALRRGRLLSTLRRHPRSSLPGLALAVGLSDGGSGSPAESWARVLLYRAGLPRPVTQCRVETARGRFHADLGWPDQRVALEYDSAEHHSSRVELERDRRRYSAMTHAGWEVVSIGMHDLRTHPERLLRRVRDLLLDRGWRPSPTARERVRRAVRRIERDPPRLDEG